MIDFALRFNGLTSKLSYTIASAPTNTTSISISAWVRNGFLATNSPNAQNILAYGYTRMYLRLGNPGISVPRIRFDESIAHEANAGNATDLPVDGLPAHLVGVYEYTGGTNSQLRIYVNGVLKASTNNTVLPTTNYAPTTGVIGATSSNFFKGIIGQTKIYHAALTTAQVLSLYQTGVNPVAPQVEFNFNEGSGLSAADNSGNNQTGTLAGTTLPKWVGSLNNLSPFPSNFKV